VGVSRQGVAMVKVVTCGLITQILLLLLLLLLSLLVRNKT
jgi:hypothetical protein